MPNFVFANNVSTTITSAIGALSTTIVLASSANFPAIPAGFVWAVTLNDAATGTFYEVVYATSVSGNVLTVLRGQEGTTARAWNVNDFAFAADTAGILSSFATQAQLGGFVQLNPGSPQSGSINITGGATVGILTSGGGVSVGGALSNATIGTFSNNVTAPYFLASQAYGNTAIASLPLRFFGAGGVIGVGPSTGLSANGITASSLAIGNVATGKIVAFDSIGNISAYQNVYAQNGIFSNQVFAVEFVQSGKEVLDTVTSSTLNVNKTGSSVEIEIGGQTIIGASFMQDGNGGSASLTLPNYGAWFLEVIYAVTQTTNNNLTITLSLSGGTITGGFISNANGVTAFNSNAWITIYGKGHTTVNNQTLTFAFAVSGGTIDGSNQPWTVRATRTA